MRSFSSTEHHVRSLVLLFVGASLLACSDGSSAGSGTTPTTGGDGGTRAGGGDASGGGGSGGGGAGGAKRVFVTSSTWTGDLERPGGATSGPDGADALCRAAASAAGLGGASWTAWISVSGHGAIDRLSYGGPWVTVGGKTAFRDKTTLTTGPLAAITDEHGAITTNAAWTGTDPPGSASGYDCTFFTDPGFDSRGLVGDPNAVGSTKWTSLEVRRCNTTAAVMCFEQ